MCRRWLPFVIALGVSFMGLSSLAALERRTEASIRSGQSAEYVDMGIRLIVVERDPNGVPMVPGNSQKMREVARYERGGIVKMARDDDSRLSAHIVRESKNPVVWFASRAQADLILHDGPCQWALVQGSEGAGKTTLLAMWLAFRVIDHIGFAREIGLTAPTGPRLITVRKEIAKYWRPSWFEFRARENFYQFHAGPLVQCVTAVAKSKDLGSPNQGNNWVAAAHDELQDHFEREPDFETRGRSAPDAFRDGKWVEAWYPRLCTSTFKDSSTWRTFRAACVANSNEAAPTWSVTKLLGMESPFIPLAHWEKLRTSGTMTPREFRRRVLAEEVGPEAQLYHCWFRGDQGAANGNLRPLPSLTSAVNYEDVTAEVLRPFVPPNVQAVVLAGHDPGKRQHVTVYLKAFRFAADVRRGDRRPRWFVIGETTSPDSTVEMHVQEVLKRARSQWGCNEPTRDSSGRPIPGSGARQLLVRIDPHSKGSNEHPGRDFYSIWRSFGFIAKAANYDGDKPSQIKVDSRINLVNTLLCAQSDEGETRRLFVACDEHGSPLTKNGQAEHVVDSFESMERNEAGEAEHERKDKHDKSHWTAAIGYALWQVERDNVHRRAA